MNDNKHVQLPNGLIKVSDMKPKDLLVYLALKTFEDWNTHIAFPSHDRVAKLCSCARNTVSSSIDRLVASGFLSKVKKGNINGYKFEKYEHFECFSLEFLNNPDLSFQEKAYLVALQQFMIKDNGVGKITDNISVLSNKVHLSPSSIIRCDNSLIKRGFMAMVDLHVKDAETGCLKKEKMYDLIKLGQAIVFKLQELENTVNANYKELKEKYDILEKNYNLLKETIFKMQSQREKDNEINIQL